MSRCPYPNRALRTAWFRGQRAAAAGRPRTNPYDIANVTTLDFYKAWYQGFDRAKAAEAA